MNHKKGFMSRIIFSMIALCGMLFVASNAYAGGNDFKLERLCDSASGAGCSTQTAIDDFGALARTYGSLFAPMHMNPASTIGQEGFEIGVETKLSFATEDSHFWKATNKNNSSGTLANPTSGSEANGDAKYAAPDVFATIEMSMRKGLPFSLEVEGNVSWLANSEMFYVGAGLRWAVLEGFWYLPDISVRGHVGTVVGSSQISMVNVNIDAAISYTWGLGGIASITPYAGYAHLINITSSRPIVLYRDTTDGAEAYESVFNRQTQNISRGFVGVQLKGEFFIFDVAGEFGKDVSSVGLKIGALF